MNTNIFADAEEFYSRTGCNREERLELRKNSRGEADVIVCEQQVIRNTFIHENQIIGNQLNNEDWSDKEKTQRKMCMKLNLSDSMRSEHQFGSELSTPTDQIRRKSVESQRKSSLDGGAINSNRKTPSSIPRQLIGETFSPSPSLARSPAMHEGFRAQDWRVERTPINTPDANMVTKRLPLLSDDEDDQGETDSVNTETDPISKGSGTSSFLPSSVDISESKTGSSIPEKDNSSTKMHLCSSSMSGGDAAGCRLTASESQNVNVNREIQGFEMQQHSEQSILREEESLVQDVEEDASLPAAFVQPPADFADSPIRSPPQPLQTQQSSVQSVEQDTEDDEVLKFEQVADIDNDPSVSSQGHEQSSKSKCGNRENFTLKESYHHPELVVCQRQGISYFKRLPHSKNKLS